MLGLCWTLENSSSKHTSAWIDEISSFSRHYSVVIDLERERLSFVSMTPDSNSAEGCSISCSTSKVDVFTGNSISMSIQK